MLLKPISLWGKTPSGPATLTNWWDATQGRTLSTDVGVWVANVPDATNPKGHFFGASTNEKPPSFDTTNNALNVDAANEEHLTHQGDGTTSDSQIDILDKYVFLKVTPHAVSGVRQLIVYRDTDNVQLRIDSGKLKIVSASGFYGAVENVGTTTLSANTTYVFAFNLRANGADSWINDNIEHSLTSSPFPTEWIAQNIGVRRTSDEPFDGLFHNVVICDDTLTSSERSAISTWLETDGSSGTDPATISATLEDYRPAGMSQVVTSLANQEATGQGALTPGTGAEAFPSYHQPESAVYFNRFSHLEFSPLDVLDKTIYIKFKPLQKDDPFSCLFGNSASVGTDIRQVRLNGDKVEYTSQNDDYGVASFTSTATINFATWQIIRVQILSGKLNIQVDGLDYIDVTAPGPTSAEFGQIGDFAPGASNGAPFWGWIKHVRIYDGTPTAQQDSEIRTFLSNN